MKILISPAKSLDYSTALPTIETSKPAFLKQAKIIQKELKKYQPNDLKELMHISESLAQLNWTRNQERKLSSTILNETHRQALFAFNGDVYEGIDAYSLATKELDYLDAHLRILSGLYGFLKPKDVIEPYRLEMGTRMAVGESSNLYHFWKPLLALQLKKELKKQDVVVNLASNEYFKAIDTKILERTVITPEFKEYRDGQLKTIGFFAKKARGQMVRFMAKNQISDVEQLKTFAEDGYSYDEKCSSARHWVFTR